MQGCGFKRFKVSRSAKDICFSACSKWSFNRCNAKTTGALFTKPNKQGLYECCPCAPPICESITNRAMVTKMMLVSHVKKQITFWDITSHIICSRPESISYTLTTCSYLCSSGKRTVSRLGICSNLSLLNATLSFCGKRAI